MSGIKTVVIALLGVLSVVAATPIFRGNDHTHYVIHVPSHEHPTHHHEGPEYYHSDHPPHHEHKEKPVVEDMYDNDAALTRPLAGPARRPNPAEVTRALRVLAQFAPPTPVRQPLGPQLFTGQFVAGGFPAGQTPAGPFPTGQLPAGQFNNRQLPAEFFRALQALLGQLEQQAQPIGTGPFPAGQFPGGQFPAGQFPNLV